MRFIPLRLSNPLRAKPRAAWVAPGLFLLFFLWFATLRVLQHYSFRTHVYDLSIYDYALYYTLRGRFLWTPFLPGPNILADHFSPALLGLVPLYLIDDGPLGLLIVQAVFVVASGIPLYLTARTLLGSRVLACGLTVAYFGNRFVVRGLLYDFHPEMALPALFLTGLWLIEIKQRPGSGTVVFSLSMLVKEDVPIYVAAVALYFLMRRTWRVGLGLAVTSVTYGLFVSLVGFPSLFGGEPPFALSAWSLYGKTVPEIAGYFLDHPGEALGVFWSTSLLRLFATFGFLPLLAPTVLLPAVPALFIALSGSEGQRQLAAYYSAPALPFLAWASIRALQRLRGWPASRPKVIAAIVVAILTLVVNSQNLRIFTVTQRDRTAHGLIAGMPRTGAMAAPGHIIPHLAKRPDMYVIGATWRQQPVQCILLDTRRGFWPFSHRSLVRLATDLEGDPSYRKVFDHDGYLVFRRVQITE